MKIRILLLVALPLCLAPIGLMGWYRWDSADNHGLKFGYYGAFNRVRQALAALPGVTITREWANRDVTLEEFGFDLRTEAALTISLDFQEGDLSRGFSGERLSRALEGRIQSNAQIPAGSK